MFQSSLVSRVGDAGFRIGDLLRQLRQILRTPVAAAGLRGKTDEQVAVLLRVEVLGDAVHALKGQDVAADLVRCLAAR